MVTTRRAALHLAFASLILVGAAPGTALARITRVEITRIESPAFGGASFDRVGPYERLIGRAYGEVDPKLAANAVIQDIEAVRRAAQELVSQRFLLDADAAALVAEAERDGIRVAP